MKIAYVTPKYFGDSAYLGGGERYVHYLARGVVQSGGGDSRVDIISFAPEARTQELEPGLTLRVLAVPRMPSELLDVVSWDIPSALENADVVHVHQVFTRMGEVTVLAAGLLGKPLCVTDHGGATSALGHHLEVVEVADRVVAYSQFGASLLTTRVPKVVIPGGVDGAFFTPASAPTAREGFLFVGRLMPHKGIDRLIAALPPEFPLTVCGQPYDPVYMDRLLHLARDKHVKFLTDASDTDLLDLYRRSWATILPSVYTDLDGRSHVAPELMGLSLLESMACGTPAICSRVGAMPEFVSHGDTGFVFDTVDELSDYLRQIAGDPELVGKMGTRARRAVDEYFDLRIAGARMLDLYREIAP